MVVATYLLQYKHTCRTQKCFRWKVQKPYATWGVDIYEVGSLGWVFSQTGAINAVSVLKWNRRKFWKSTRTRDWKRNVGEYRNSKFLWKIVMIISFGDWASCPSWNSAVCGVFHWDGCTAFRFLSILSKSLLYWVNFRAYEDVFPC